MTREIEKEREGEKQHMKASQREEEMQRGQKKRQRVSLGKLSAGSGSICHHGDVSFQKFTLNINLLFSSK